MSETQSPQFVRKDDSEARARIDNMFENKKPVPSWLMEPEKKNAAELASDTSGSTPETEKETLELVFEGKSYRIPADYNQDNSVFLLPDGRVLTYDSIRGDVPDESDLQVAYKVSDIVYPGTDETLTGLSNEELREKIKSVGRNIVEAK